LRITVVDGYFGTVALARFDARAHRLHLKGAETLLRRHKLVFVNDTAETITAQNAVQHRPAASTARGDDLRHATTAGGSVPQPNSTIESLGSTKK